MQQLSENMADGAVSDFYMCLPKLDYDQLASFVRGEITRYVLEAETYMGAVEKYSASVDVDD